MRPKAIKRLIRIGLALFIFLNASTVLAQVGNTTPTVAAPIADLTVAEDAPTTSVDLWAAFADVEDPDNALIYTVTTNSNPTLVTTSINPAAGTLSLNFALNGNGSATITVRATDTGALFVEDTFQVTVTPVNDKPTTSGLPNVTVDEDAATVNVNLGTYFSDVDNTLAQLTFTRTAHTNPTLLDAYISPPSTLVLDFAPNAFGTADITITATDPGGLSESSTFLVTVNPVNDQPTVTASLGNVNVLEDAAPTSIDLWPAFADIEDADNLMAYTVVANTNPGLFAAITVTGGRYLVLAYMLNANGAGQITVRATDTGGLSIQTSFSVNVTPVNDAPVATDDTYNVVAGQTITIGAPGILHNDTDVENDPLKALLLSPPLHGQLQFSPNGSFTYGTPSAYFYGSDSFQYLVTDGDLKSNPVRVTILISPVENILSKPLNATVSERWVPIKGGRTERLSCTDEAGKILVLDNGDAVEFLGCLDVGRGWIAPIPEESLPGPLPFGSDYVSAFKLGVTIKGYLQTYLNGGMILMFDAPQAQNYAILFWDPDRGTSGGWVEFPAYGQTADLGNGRKVFSGVRYFNGRVVSTVNMTGTFVLVRK